MATRTYETRRSKIARAAAPDPRPDRSRRAKAQTQAASRYARLAVQKAPRVIFPQWLRTTLVVLLWLAFVPLYLQLIAPIVSYRSAQAMGVGLAIFAGLACHLWPTRTAPWRTVAWAATVTSFLGPMLLVGGLGRLGLAVTTVIGFLIVVLRVNQNGRKLLGLIRTWWRVR